jgi:hypothetical protein
MFSPSGAGIMAEPADKKPKPRRRGCLVIGFFALIVIIIAVLIWFFIKREYAKHYLNTRLAEEQARWRSAHPEVMDPQNRRIAYLQMDRLLVSGSVAQSEIWIDWMRPRHFEIGMSWPSNDAILRRVANDRKYLTDALIQSGRMPFFGFSPDFADVFPMQPSTDMQHGSYFAHLAVIQAWIYLRDGKYPEADLLLSSLLRKSADHAQGGIIDVMSGVQGIGMAMAPIFEEINRSGWTAKDLRAFADSFEMEMDRFPPVSDMNRNERLNTLLLMAGLQQGTIQTGWAGNRRRWRDSMIILGVRRYDEVIEETLRALELPRKEGQDALRKIISENADMNFLSRQNPSNYLMEIGLIDFASFRNIRDMALADLRIANASLRMQAARLETGGYPSSMAALSKIDGRPVLMDPFDEQPIKIKLNPDGSCRVYSVGPNMTDDNGNNPEIARYAGVSPTIVDPATLNAQTKGKPGILAPKLSPPGPPGDDFYFHLVPLPAKQ